MKEIFNKIWDMALEYQDKRNDPGHAEVTLSYAQKLLGLVGGNEDVVIPAIILHDIGWSQVSDRLTVFDPKAKKEDRKRVVALHQQYSVEKARPILEKVGYPEDLIKEILEIISQHDTRKGFLSVNDGVVRDADKLWRVSQRGVAAAMARSRRKNRMPFNKKMQKGTDKEGYFYSDAARNLAHEEIAARKKEQGEAKQPPALVRFIKRLFRLN